MPSRRGLAANTNRLKGKSFRLQLPQRIPLAACRVRRNVQVPKPGNLNGKTPAPVGQRTSFHMVSSISSGAGIVHQYAAGFCSKRKARSMSLSLEAMGFCAQIRQCGSIHAGIWSICAGTMNTCMAVLLLRHVVYDRI